MHIDEIPNELIATILDYLDSLDDLLSCFKVCIRWKQLIARRTTRCNYLLNSRSVYSEDFTGSIRYNHRKQYDEKLLSEMFPNLKIADLRYLNHATKVNHFSLNLLRNSQCLKVVILCPDSRFKTDEGRKLEFNAKTELEMISNCYINEGLKKIGFRIKQLHLIDYSYYIRNFRDDIQHFPNLERLHVYTEAKLFNGNYDGIVFEKLGILEAPADYGTFRFIDFCPNLQSAYLLLYREPNEFSLSQKHQCLQDLVVDYGGFFYESFALVGVLRKFPKLKHLAVRSSDILKNEDINQLINSFPNLKLLYVHNCRGVTQTSVDFVKDYNRRHGRSIDFYCDLNEDQIETNWPQLSFKRERISRGFDFMKHCFLKELDDLPVFLFPNNYFV